MARECRFCCWSRKRNLRSLIRDSVRIGTSSEIGTSMYSSCSRRSNTKAGGASAWRRIWKRSGQFSFFAQTPFSPIAALDSVHCLYFCSFLLTPCRVSILTAPRDAHVVLQLLHFDTNFLQFDRNCPDHLGPASLALGVVSRSDEIRERC